MSQPPGATLHLGGDAWAHPALEPHLRPIEEVSLYPGNPRRHDQVTITQSIRDLGLYTGVVAQQSSGHVVVGNGRLTGLRELGATRVPAIIVDVPDDRAAAIVARDNRTSDLATNDPTDLLALLDSFNADAALLRLAGYQKDDVEELRRLVEGVDVSGYTRKTSPVQYDVTGVCPPLGDLVDRGKTDRLTAQILDANLPPDLTEFLTAGAQRHLVFNYANVAEYYAHATPEVQALMEASALVIVDFNDAIHYGFVRLSKTLQGLLAADEQDTTDEG